MAIPTRNRIESLDVPAEQVEAAVKLQQARLLDDLQQAQACTDGRLAEQRHLLDADPDTAFPLPGIPHPKVGGTA